MKKVDKKPEVTHNFIKNINYFNEFSQIINWVGCDDELFNHIIANF